MGLNPWLDTGYLVSIAKVGKYIHCWMEEGASYCDHEKMCVFLSHSHVPCRATRTVYVHMHTHKILVCEWAMYMIIPLSDSYRRIGLWLLATSQCLVWFAFSHWKAARLLRIGSTPLPNRPAHTKVNGDDGINFPTCVSLLLLHYHYVVLSTYHIRTFFVYKKATIITTSFLWVTYWHFTHIVNPKPL